MTIELLLFDIDGVLTDGEAQPLDLDLIAQLRRFNLSARTDRSRPPVTICSGRPAPYVELMLQAIDGQLPAVYENGAGLYLPATYRFLPHPQLDERPMHAVRDRLQQALVESGRAYFQPGKSFTLTLFATDPAATDRLQSWATAALGSLAAAVDLVYSVSCLNVLPSGIDKGMGVSHLAAHCAIEPGHMLGVGDSDVDIPMLKAVGYSAAPANAGVAIRRVVQYVSPFGGAAGVRDILRHFGQV